MRTSTNTTLSLLAGCLLLACGTTTPPDDTMSDSAVPDSAMPDSGVPDGAAPDSAVPANNFRILPFKIIAIGDSAFLNPSDPWASIPITLQSIANERGFTGGVNNNAVNGAFLSCGISVPGTPRNCVPRQREDVEAGELDWTHVLVAAGRSDMRNRGCPSAEEYISSDLSSGLMVDLVNGIRDLGHLTILFGYYEPLDPAEATAPAVCDQLWIMMDRYRDLAAGREDILFVDAREVVPREMRYYANPIQLSATGSTAVAEYIADQLGYTADP